MTSLRTQYLTVIAVLVALVLTGCTAFVDDQNKEANALGMRIISQLKAQPSVADANYIFKSSLDVSPRMAVSVLVKPEQATHDVAQRLVDLAMDTYWQSSADVQTFSVSVYSAAHPPVAGQDNLKREIDGGEVHLNAEQRDKSKDQLRLERKFGQRRAPTPTKK